MTSPFTWSFLFDWDGDGSYGYEECTRVVAPFSLERGRADEFSSFEAGKASITLRNDDGRFSPWNAASPLYGKVLPGRGVKVSLTYDGTTYPLFVGRIEDIKPIGGRRGGQRVSVTAYDGLRYLAENSCSIALQTSKRTDELIAAVLDDAGWPSGASHRDLGTGSDTLGYWWTPKRSALSVIRELAQSEMGLFFISRDGKATFRSRAWVVSGSAVGAVSQEMATDIVVNQPWESVYNAVKVVAHPVSIADLAEIWRLVDTGIRIDPGQSATVWADYRDAQGRPCAATDVVTPVAVTDYTANTAPDGTGTDMTSYMSVAAGVFSTSCKLTVSNTGSEAAYITLLRLRGRALSTTDVGIAGEDEASQASYGKRALERDLVWQQSATVAADLCASLLAFYAVPRKSVQLAMEMRLPDLVRYELGDRIGVSIAQYDLDETMRLGKLRLQAQASMYALAGTFWLEPADNQRYWLVGVDGNSEIGISTMLGY